MEAEAGLAEVEEDVEAMMVADSREADEDVRYPHCRSYKDHDG